MDLDRDKLLAGDPATTNWALNLARRWVMKTFNSKSTVDSLTQSAMAEAVARLQKETVEPDRVGYVILACANNVVRRKITSLKNKMHEVFDSQLHSPPETAGSELLWLRSQLARVDDALRRCDERTQQILLARASGASYEEICSDFGGEVDTMRAFVMRERRKLRTELTAGENRQLLINEARRFGFGEQVEAILARSAPADS